MPPKTTPPPSNHHFLVHVTGLLLIILLTAIATYYFSPPKSLNSYITGGSSGTTAETTGISVSGSSTVYVEPDVAVMRFGIETHDADIKIAQEKNKSEMTDLMGAFKSLGIEDKDLQTSNYYVYTSYDYDDDNWPFPDTDVPKVEYYSVNNTLTVKIRDLDSIEEVINTAVEAGANDIGNISFSLEDYADARAKAYAEAAEIVQERAEYVADSLNVNLGPLLYVNTFHSNYNYNWYGTSYAANQAVSFDSYQGGGDGSISTGQIEVKVEMNVRYGIAY